MPITAGIDVGSGAVNASTLMSEIANDMMDAVSPVVVPDRQGVGAGSDRGVPAGA